MKIKKKSSRVRLLFVVRCSPSRCRAGLFVVIGDQGIQKDFLIRKIGALVCFQVTGQSFFIQVQAGAVLLCHFPGQLMAIFAGVGNNHQTVVFIYHLNKQVKVFFNAHGVS